MATQFYDHLERLRAKPHPVRRRIAFASSLVVTGLVAAGWLGAMTTSQSLAIKPKSITKDEQVREVFSDTNTSFSQLMGAAGAAFGATSSAAQVTVVDTKRSSTMDQPEANMNATSQTVIRF